MKHDIILAGVGGQGVLTVSKVISALALARGLHIKQAETHGMSQRGGTVQSHLRLSDKPIASDLVRVGRADLLIAVEPLEALRYRHMLSSDGALVASVNAFVNIPNYPGVEALLDQIAAHPRHVLVDAERLARAAGSGRAANTVVLGAASVYLELDPAALEETVATGFAAAGERVAEVNRRAFRFGRNAALAYLDGLGRGAASTDVRHWIDTLGAEHLAAAEPPDAPSFDVIDSPDHLSGAEAHAVERMLEEIYQSGRRQLFEHEVYAIVQLVGAISPPQHVFVNTEEMLAPEALARFPGERVVLKLVSPDVVHKSDVQAIAFVPKEADLVQREIDRLIGRHREAGADVRGVLVVEFVERQAAGLGHELFVGIRATREFGPVIAAGLGGVDTEYLARRMRPGVAVAKAIASDTTAEDFLEQFKETAAYELLAGQARGHQRIVSDGELLRCFRAFISLATRFCIDRGEVGPDVAELEVNPFAFRRQAMVPLDGRGRLGTATVAPAARPIERVRQLLEPEHIALVGVSSDADSFGRIILRNLLAGGASPERLTVVKPGASEVDGVRCVPSLDALPAPADLLVVTASARALPGIVQDAVTSGKVASAILVSGGVGELAGSEAVSEAVHEAIAEARRRPDGPVFLGPNSLGVVSRPGGYDTFFIPQHKLDKRAGVPPRPVAIISQSGAFIISRLSRLERLDPAITVSIGNQFDLTLADLLTAIGHRDDIDVIGVYAEGFSDLDGLAFLRAIAALREAGKDVVFYKAGRTEQGRSAAAGHTASVAGDYDICVAGARAAGALVADTFDSFEQLLELTTALHHKVVRGVRLGAVSNAGFETVGMADSLRGDGHRIELAALGEADGAALSAVIAAHHLAGLVNAHNPVDVTPMADEAAYDAVCATLLAADTVDALVVGCVPLTARLKTTPEEIGLPGSFPEVLAARFGASDKPVVAVIDAGTLYDPMVRRLREAGVPVFRSADQAVRVLGQYLVHRVER
ncbi:MAG: CoA-binding protein [Deltaproteobacteria bacterium HGW-Deltaproteobacteria-14]|jgi:indolepyruvate ferredoxin oxidoreductase beta subunit|nr:MAG: CoA-binding protein [Deltaproteobacteria bacterium HGW-Deltaproteobacteria-14]